MPSVAEPAEPHASRLRVRLLMAVLAAVLYATDQVTKVLAVRHLDPLAPPSYLGGFLKLRLVHNPGAAFSFGSSATVVFSVLALVALVVLLVVVAPRVTDRWGAVLTAMALAGVAGNFTDRLLRAPGPFRGHVVDFFQIPHWAIFNVADICLTSVAVLMVLRALVVRPEAPDEAADPGSDDEDA